MDEERHCWVCHDPDSTGRPLDSGFCQCRGTMGTVHAACLTEMCNFRGDYKCPACQEFFLFQELLLSTAPSLPQSFLARQFFVLRYFTVPFIVSIIFLLFLQALHFILFPFLVGFLLSHFEGIDTVLNDLEWNRATLLNIFLFFLQHWPKGALFMTLRRFLVDHWKEYSNFLEKHRRNALHNVDNDEEENHEDLPQQPNIVSSDHIVGALINLRRGCRWLISDQKGSPLCGLMQVRYDLFFSALLLPGFSYPKSFVGITILLALILRFLYPLPPRVPKDVRHRARIEYRLRSRMSQGRQFITFATLLMDIIIFSGILPIGAGYLTHYSTAPFLEEVPTLSDLMIVPGFFGILVHWILGFIFILTLLTVEQNLMVTLFAPGVDLFIARSFLVDVERHAWGNMLTYIFGLDPLSIIFTSFRFMCIQFITLFIIIHGSLRSFFALEKFVWRFVHHPLVNLLRNTRIGSRLGSLYQYHRRFPLDFIPRNPISFKLNTPAIDKIERSKELNSSPSPNLFQYSHFVYPERSQKNPIRTLKDFERWFEHYDLPASARERFNLPKLMEDRLSFSPEPLWIEVQSYDILQSTVLLIFAFTIIACIFMFPIRRFLLCLMLPLARSLAKPLGLTDFLFDEARVAVLDEWLLNGSRDIGLEGDASIDVNQLMPPFQNPPIPPAELDADWLFDDRGQPLAPGDMGDNIPVGSIERAYTGATSRRQQQLPKHRLPNFLRLKLITFSFLFFSIGFSILLAHLFLSMLILSVICQYSSQIIILGILLLFFAWHPVIGSLSLIIVLLLPIGLFLMSIPFDYFLKLTYRDIPEVVHKALFCVGQIPLKPPTNKTEAIGTEPSDISSNSEDEVHIEEIT